MSKFSPLFNAFQLLWMIVLLPELLAGQAIATDPAFPREDEPVTIIFDATEAERDDLVDYDRDLWAHTGVILSEEDKNSGNWEFVIADWPVNIDRAKNVI